MNKDLIDDQFGRYREFAIHLKKLGHNVEGLCLSYKHKKEGLLVDFDDSTGVKVNWHSFSSGRLGFIGLIKFFQQALIHTKIYQPDIIIAGSDSFYLILANWISKKTNTKVFFDVYDVYERFAAFKIPFIKAIYTNTIKQADGYFFYFKNVLKLYKDNYLLNDTSKLLLLENGVKTEYFSPLNKDKCRKDLNLPKYKKIIGYVGGTDSQRGLDIIIDTIPQLESEFPDVIFIIAGPKEPKCIPPNSANVKYIGNLSWKDVGKFINSMDLAVIPHRKTEYSDYIFFQKFYEIQACRIPFIASSVGFMNEALSDYPNQLFDLNAPESFIKAASLQLKNPTILDIKVPTWEDQSRILAKFIKEIFN